MILRVCVALLVVLGFALAQAVPDLAALRAKLEAGDYPAVILKLEPYLKSRPQDADARFLLARAYYLQGGAESLSRAEEAIRAALRVQPGRPEFEWLFGLILDRQGRSALALQRLKIAASGDPRGPNAKDIYRYAMDWGLVAWREGDLQGALEAFSRAARAAPTEVWPLVHGGKVLLSLNEPEQALSTLSRAIAVLNRYGYAPSHPAQPEAYYWRGRAFEALGRFAEARADFQAALERDAAYGAARDALEGVRGR